MAPRITIETTTQSLAPKPDCELTLADLLAIRRMPTNFFQAYAYGDGDQVRPIPSDTRLHDLQGICKVELRCIMNPNFSEFLEIVGDRQSVADAVTTLAEVNLGIEGCEKIVHEIDDEIARGIVGEAVAGFVREHSKQSPVLAGVSGGGDSNALIGALQRALLADDRRLVAFTLVSNPIWPAGSATRAAMLCEQHDVEHVIIDGPALERLLGMTRRVSDYYEAFLDRYGPNTAHFFGTHMVSAAGRRLCREHGTTEYCLGFNREDVLAEVLFSVFNGRTPLAYPLRRFGDINLLMPVWQVPKLVLDACYPDLSKRNYEERIPTTPQRGFAHFLGHAVDDVYPNLGLSLMDGLRRMLADSWPRFREESAFDVYAEEIVTDEELAATIDFLSGYFRPSDDLADVCL